MTSKLYTNRSIVISNHITNIQKDKGKKLLKCNLVSTDLSGQLPTLAGSHESYTHNTSQTEKINTKKKSTL